MTNPSRQENGEPSPKLRPYQKQAIDRIRAMSRKGNPLSLTLEYGSAAPEKSDREGPHNNHTVKVEG